MSTPRGESVSAAIALRRGGYAERVVRITGNKLPTADWERGQLWIEPKPGCCVVEMAPVPQYSGSILIPDVLDGEWRNRPDIGVVLASSDEVPYDPGTCVVVDHEHGKRIEGAVFGPYEAENEVRVYGRCWQSGGRSVYVPWHRSILGELVSLGTLEEPGIVIRPSLDKVIVQRDDLYEKSEGGIHIPDNVKHRTTKGTVVSAGPWAGIIPTREGGWKRVDRIERGMRVLYSAQNVRRFVCPGVDDRLLVMVEWSDILCELHGEELSPLELAALPMTERAHHPNDDMPLERAS